VRKGVAWELERTAISLRKKPVWHAGIEMARRGLGSIRTRISSPKGDTNKANGPKVSGSERDAKRPEMEKR